MSLLKNRKNIADNSHYAPRKGTKNRNDDGNMTIW